MSRNQQINAGTENSYHNPLPQSSHFNKLHCYPVRTTTCLGILLEIRRGNGQCKFSFNKAVILKRILNIFKSALTGFPCISNLSATTALYSLSIFCWNSFNFGSALTFCDTKSNFNNFIGKKLKIKQFK